MSTPPGGRGCGRHGEGSGEHAGGRRVHVAGSKRIVPRCLDDVDRFTPVCGPMAPAGAGALVPCRGLFVLPRLRESMRNCLLPGDMAAFWLCACVTVERLPATWLAGVNLQAGSKRRRCGCAWPWVVYSSRNWIGRERAASVRVHMHVYLTCMRCGCMEELGWCVFAAVVLG